jgi:hypothetical protein
VRTPNDDCGDDSTIARRYRGGGAYKKEQHDTADLALTNPKRADDSRPKTIPAHRLSAETNYRNSLMLKHLEQAFGNHGKPAYACDQGNVGLRAGLSANVSEWSYGRLAEAAAGAVRRGWEADDSGSADSLSPGQLQAEPIVGFCDSQPARRAVELGRYLGGVRQQDSCKRWCHGECAGVNSTAETQALDAFSCHPRYTVPFVGYRAAEAGVPGKEVTIRTPSAPSARARRKLIKPMTPRRASGRTPCRFVNRDV